jgi:hypothetical protein
MTLAPVIHPDGTPVMSPAALQRAYVNGWLTLAQLEEALEQVLQGQVPLVESRD